MPISVQDLNLPLRGAPGWDVPIKAAIVELVDSVNAQEALAEEAIGAVQGAVDASDASIAASVDSPTSATRAALVDGFVENDVRSDSLFAAAALRNLPGTITPRAELGLSFSVTANRSASGVYTSTLEPESRHTPAASGPTYYVNKATGSIRPGENRMGGG